MASFNNTSQASTSKHAQSANPLQASSSALPDIKPSLESLQQPKAEPIDDEDFEASLVEGMESLLRQLAGTHPPGPMPDIPNVKQEPLDPGEVKPNIPRPPAPSANLGENGLSPEEEEAAWQRAVEMMLSGEGLEALGLDQSGQPKSNSSTHSTSTSAKGKTEVKQEKEGEKKPGQPNFDETIRRTMEQLKSPQGKSKAGGGAGGGGDMPDLAALLAQLGNDPSALDGLGEGDDELGGILDGMMAQLMTKEILEEPMAELASKVCSFFSPPHLLMKFVTVCVC